MGEGSGHIQSLVISGALLGSAAIVQMGGLLADVIAANRSLLEDIRGRQLRAEVDSCRADTGSAESMRPPPGRRTAAIVPLSG
jgi:hypothetical protein